MRIFVRRNSVASAQSLFPVFRWRSNLLQKSFGDLLRRVAFPIICGLPRFGRSAIVAGIAFVSLISPVGAAPPLATYISTVSGHLGSLMFTPEEACADATAYFNPNFAYAYTTGSARSGYWICYGTRVQDNWTTSSGSAIAQGSLCADRSIPDIKKPLELQCGGQQFWSTGIATGAIKEQSCRVGNPVLTGTGIKIQQENDIVGSQSGADAILRTFRSVYSLEPIDGFGSRWMHQWQRRLNGLNLESVTPTLFALRADGRTVKFSNSGGTWVAADQSRDRVEAVMVGTSRTGWKYVDADTDSTEMYDASGRLMSVAGRGGRTTTLSYSDAKTAKSIAPNVGMLIAVRDWSGRTLSFAYDSARRINSITASDGSVTRYAYDANGMLANVTWPDARMRSYHYEDSRFPSALTGITDEGGVRFATYAYDAQGRATGTEHAGGVDKFQLSFLSNGQTSVTTADASSRTFGSELQGTVLRATGATAPCPACGDIAKAVTYDVAGNVASRTDFAEKETRYSYDALGRETLRIEDYGMADAKTTTTAWHPTWNLPLRIASPNRIDGFTYDEKGQTTSYATYATSDQTGALGFGAVQVGQSTGMRWEYDASGLVVAAMDIVDNAESARWTYTYDTTGNLATLTNPQGQIGRVLSYDGAGRVLTAIDTSGLEVSIQYDNRGSVVRYQRGTEVVSYGYNATGFLTTVAGPGDLRYDLEYDDAHRLVAYWLPPDQSTQSVALLSENPFSTSATSVQQPGARGGWLAEFWKRIKSWLSSLISDANAQIAPVLVRTAIATPVPGESSPGLARVPAPSPADVLEQGNGGKQQPGSWLNSIWNAMAGDGEAKKDGDSCVKKPAIPDVTPRDLCELLALAEAKAGAGEPRMGDMADEPRLIAHYGPGPWRKMQHKHTCFDNRQIVIHYFSNGRGLNVELKFVK